MLSTSTTLAELAVKHPGASRVFHRHSLDFCCHGNRSIDEACLERGLITTSIVAEIEAEQLDRSNILRWDERPLADLIDHIIRFYHHRLREELPLLVEMACRVEKVHASKRSCPVGLASHL